MEESWLTLCSRDPRKTGRRRVSLRAGGPTEAASQGRTAHGGLIRLPPPPSSTAAPDGSRSILFPSFRCAQIKKALAGTPTNSATIMTSGSEAASPPRAGAFSFTPTPRVQTRVWHGVGAQKMWRGLPESSHGERWTGSPHWVLPSFHECVLLRQ